MNNNNCIISTLLEQYRITVKFNTVQSRQIDQGVSTFFRHITSEPLVIEQR